MLRYNGRGFVRGIPARDLSDEEVRKYGREMLLRSGVYEEVEQPKPRKRREKEETEKETED